MREPKGSLKPPPEGTFRFPQTPSVPLEGT